MQAPGTLFPMMLRRSWHPTVHRTVAEANKVVDELAATVEKFRKHFESSGQRIQKHIELWQNRLIEMLESRLLEKVLGGREGEARLHALAIEVAERKKDPFTAVSEILKGVKLEL